MTDHERPGKQTEPGDNAAEARALSERAARLFADGNLEDALLDYSRACERVPEVPEGHYNLAAAHSACGNTDAALDVIEKASQQFPDNALIHYGKACVLESRGQLDEALASYTIALSLDPGHTDAWYGVGVLLCRAGDPLRASGFFKRALDVDPDHAQSRYMREALSGVARTRPEAEFVRHLFDSYAPYYDQHMLDTLGYQAPDSLCSTVVAALDGCRATKALDLGCGTGLLGIRLRDDVDHLAGVDLAPGMLYKARESGCYDELACKDVFDFLGAQRQATYDLIVAADLFIYFADLEEVFAAIRSVLAPGGLFAYTVEQDQGDDWTVGPSGRFRHAQSYLEALCASLDFTSRSLERRVLRHDGGEPCQGFVVLWSAGQTDGQTSP